MPGGKCAALVISCIDYRFVTQIRNHLLDQGFSDSYDLLTVPGASLNLEKIKESIDISLKLHRPKKIFLFDHEDCSAYDRDNSYGRHEATLKKAKEFLKSTKSGLEIKTFIANFNAVKELS